MNDFYLIEKKLDKIEEKLAKSKTSKKDEKTPETQVSSPEKEKVLDELAEFALKDTSVGGVSAALFLSRKLFETSQHEKAIKPLNAALSHSKGQQFAQAFLQFEKMRHLVKMKKFDNAMTVIDNIISNSDIKFIHPQSLLEKAFIYEQKKQYDLATETYNQILEVAEPYSDSYHLAQRLLWSKKLNSTNKQ